MSADQRKTDKATGRDIILTIGKTMHAGLEPLLTRTLAPSLYQVYLHPDDYDRLQPVFHELEAEARRHLDNELKCLNRPAPDPPLERLGRVFGRREKASAPAREYVSTDGTWYIQFQEDPNNTLQPGDVEVVTELAVGQQPRYGGGSRTERIISTTRRLGQMETTQEVREVHDGEARQPELRQAAPPLARFRYEDDGGPKTYAMEKDEIVIGRKAEDVWVDLQLETVFDVSREHARVRRQDEKFWIKDLSTYGTSVNGRAIRPSMVVKDGQGRDIDHWEELPDGAHVELASIVALDFEVVWR